MSLPSPRTAAELLSLAGTVPYGLVLLLLRWLVQVTENRWREIAERLDVLSAARLLPEAICDLAGERLSASSVGLVLCIDRSYGPLGANDQIAGFLDEQQFALGDGPSWSCATTALPVLAGDLASAKSAVRWPAFCPAAESFGIRAAFSFPLQVGLATIAVLTAYRDVAGELSATEYVDGLTVASLATTAMMAEQSGEGTDALAAVFRAGVEDRARLQRAAGMVAEHQSINILEAMVRVRAYAFGSDRPLGDVARDICDRKLVLPAKEEQ